MRTKGEVPEAAAAVAALTMAYTTTAREQAVVLEVRGTAKTVTYANRMK